MYPAVPDRNLPSITALTARSVALSTLLGYHPPALPISALVKVGELFGIRHRAIRVALPRMVRDGDGTANTGGHSPPSGSFLSVTTLTRRAWQRRSGTCRDGRPRRTDCSRCLTRQTVSPKGS